ncbi:DUF1161 domain-containing protein [Solimonas sp. SE-A11]|uniref:DUF1161 domain-containing protein n=1 Tax=Solimonas sp. SE-A11 TaxID=3054954 RepID=UPI00259CF038|nr:DUF1161 domain-containing protein [Solimonas sp. SE-A11]MDM4768928.1 DUF1161 domain-containing protein [Solimonas sp. SE-A11]
MKQIILAAVLTLPTLAVAAKPCDELKGEIAAHLDGKGVKSYSLDVVPAAEANGGKVVGSCDAGAKRIVYKRTQSL